MCLLVKKVVVLFFYKYFGTSSANNKNAFIFSFFFIFISKRIFILFFSVLIKKLLGSYLIRLVSFNKHFIFYLHEYIIFDALLNFIYFKLTIHIHTFLKYFLFVSK
ncbi:unnamed protein product [Meloidogyne enterolobii]|uniref:Uncharacterized protein n=1 Tax=Meloidogyne enterolobii TaxID=390850 RepID=A0ACB0ZG97_MELEN